MVLIFAVSGCESTPSVATGKARDADSPARLIADAQAAVTDHAKARLYFAALLALHARGDADRTLGIVDRLLEPSGVAGAPLLMALADAQREQLERIALAWAVATSDAARIARLMSAFEPASQDRDGMAGAARALLLAARGDHPAAALALLDAGQQLANGSRQLAALGTALWRAVSNLPTRHLDSLARTAGSRDERAWWTLAKDMSEALTSVARARIWSRWQAQHPQHAAVRLPPPATRQASAAPARIAVLIPLSGDLAAAAEAVRNGIVAAYLHAKPKAQKVTFYDTGRLSVGDAYQRALASGADIIVGPLNKVAVAALAALRPSLPVVALNRLDEDAAANTAGMVQLGIPVEDEAAAIAAALAADGVERIVLFDSRASWSARAKARFEMDLDDVDIVGTGTMRGVVAATTIAGDALGITASNARHQELSRLLGGTIEFTPRRRDDVDAIVALVEEHELLSLKPALDFHFAGDLPVYVPSPALRGGGGLRRLAGVRVCDIPWRLQASTLRTAANKVFATSRGATASFFALGVDGFRIANQLARMTEHREAIAGSTGVLTLADDGRIRRQLAWAHVVRGRLVSPPRGD